MARPRIVPGELGTVSVSREANGRYRARGTTRDDGGYRYRLTAIGDTDAAAHEELQRLAAKRSTGGAIRLSPLSTLAEAIDAWLPQIRTRAQAGSLSYSTFENYETIARLVLKPRFGAIWLEHLTVGRCDRILQQLLASHAQHDALMRLRCLSDARTCTH